MQKDGLKLKDGINELRECHLVLAANPKYAERYAELNKILS
jgi:hypothetical protein